MTLIVGEEDQVKHFIVNHMPPPTEEQAVGGVMLYEMDLTCFRILDRSSIELVKKLVILPDKNPLDDATAERIDIVLDNGGLVVEVDI